MSNLTLAIMAAGMGSRYGGIKQLDRFGESGEILMEYSIYDALKAGFDRVVIIIKDEIIDDFRKTAGDRLSEHVKLDYAFQRKTDVPDWFKVPEERVKPWGTAHAVAALDGIVNEPFCVINADDFYGRQSLELVAEFLRNTQKTAQHVTVSSAEFTSMPQGSTAPHPCSASGDNTEQSLRPYRCCMAGYRAENTLSENGAVTRGVCEADGSKLIKLVERFKISRQSDGSIVDTSSNTTIPEGTSVSMNCFGLQAPLCKLMKDRFDEWLKISDVQKDEYLLPTEINDMVSSGIITVDVLPTAAKWYGVTYQEDKAPLVEKIRAMIAEGIYPKSLWG